MKRITQITKLIEGDKKKKKSQSPQTETNRGCLKTKQNPEKAFKNWVLASTLDPKFSSFGTKTRIPRRECASKLIQCAHLWWSEHSPRLPKREVTVSSATTRRTTTTTTTIQKRTHRFKVGSAICTYISNISILIN